MDVSMPGMNGVEVTRCIHAECPAVQVIGLSMFDAADQAQAMLPRRAGTLNVQWRLGPNLNLSGLISISESRCHPQSSVLAGILSCRGFESRISGVSSRRVSTGGLG